jgi:hypothetical protein
MPSYSVGLEVLFRNLKKIYDARTPMYESVSHPTLDEYWNNSLPWGWIERFKDMIRGGRGMRGSASFKIVEGCISINGVHRRVHDYPMDVYPIVEIKKNYRQQEIKPYQHFCSVLSNRWLASIKLTRAHKPT